MMKRSSCKCNNFLFALIISSLSCFQISCGNSSSQNKGEASEDFAKKKIDEVLSSSRIDSIREVYKGKLEEKAKRGKNSSDVWVLDQADGESDLNPKELSKKFKIGGPEYFNIKWYVDKFSKETADELMLHLHGYKSKHEEWTDLSVSLNPKYGVINISGLKGFEQVKRFQKSFTQYLIENHTVDKEALDFIIISSINSRKYALGSDKKAYEYFYEHIFLKQEELTTQQLETYTLKNKFEGIDSLLSYAIYLTNKISDDEILEVRKNMQEFHDFHFPDEKLRVDVFRNKESEATTIFQIGAFDTFEAGKIYREKCLGLMEMIDSNTDKKDDILVVSLENYIRLIEGGSIAEYQKYFEVNHLQ